ncbi:hypothetical protein FS837_010371 [Tulasnella sp. UAMH 9824]|nr:hypothetical protein FS837_010371 [Tulasnella sp. UAMH 9824]
MAINQPPPPPLKADIENLVFTHKSLFGKPASIIDDSEDPQDWERVAFLGEGILLAAMSRVLYYAYPRRRTSALKPTRTGLLSKESLAAITDSYRFMEKLKCLEPSRPNIARSLDNRAALAESFVGGLALQYGMDQARKWAERMLAWKHDLPVPISDEERLGIGGSTGGKDVVMRDVGDDTGTPPEKVPVGAMAAAPPPPAAPPPVTSFPPHTARFGQPVHTMPPRPDLAQIQPPQELQKPIMPFQIPVQEPMYNPSGYQGVGLGVHSEMAATVAAAAATATKPTAYTASSFYPISSFQTPPQPVPFKQSPPAPTTISPPHPTSEYKNYPPAQPNFFDSISYQQAPPTPAPQPQPQPQPPTKYVPAWNPQVPGANLFQYDAPSPIGPTAVPNKTTGGLPTKSLGSSTYTPPPSQPPLAGFVTVAKLNEQAQKRCQRLQWNFSSEGQGQYITWTAQLLVRGDLVAEGRGQSKQIAKERAAQEAIERLGWKVSESWPGRNGMPAVDAFG